MIFHVAEKPSVARELSQVLSRSTSTFENTSPHNYCKNYRISEGVIPLLNGSIVTSVMGHIKEVDFSPGHEQWQLNTLSALFDAPLSECITAEAKDIIRNLENLSRRCQTLFIWTDCDLEGEFIAWEVSQVCLSVNAQLRVFRMRYSSLHIRDLLSAIDSRGDIKQLMVDAVKTRRELDLRFGAIFTRLQTLKTSPLFGKQRVVVSYGPCQFPTLGFVVEQYKRHVNHSSVLKWNIKIVGIYKRRKFEAAWYRGPVYDKMISHLYYVSLQSQLMFVENIQTKSITKRKPLPLRTVEFQKFLTKYLKISSEKLMKMAEELYLKGFISYPRTETDAFNSSFDFKSILESLKTDSELGIPIESLLQSGICRPRCGRHNDKSHPPIHPLKAGLGLTGDLRRVYEYVQRRFVAGCMNDAKGLKTEVRFRVCDECFKASSLSVIEHNYLEVYPYEKWNESFLPSFNVGDEISNWSSQLFESVGSPPDLLTESGLIGCMDRNQIGTDATIHEHIHKVMERRYVVQIKGQKLLPSVLGLKLAEFYDSFTEMSSLTKPQLRASFEKQLQSIVDGNVSYAQVTSRYLEIYQQVFNAVHMRFDSFVQSIRSSLAADLPISELSVTTALRCHCGLITKKSSARTERNMGREFYSCIKEIRKCDFFQWA